MLETAGFGEYIAVLLSSYFLAMETDNYVDVVLLSDYRRIRIHRRHFHHPQ